ncbi:GspH/FimT family pseudopilin [Legionella bononiensis]|uniref:Type II secretion system protein H n=1 Tax=Legionella bononiensis TaxID=2793102 RepID=A0ABS1WAI5_9GAMM|nr:GspH/FimT family pseudopilin [Legionella bononiensis]MBL7480401.1 GspH/FimT family pseudopilin [Legionella bononiensis]MBL7526367.1 GspH/FimT family pseudopilin [Legionella bononiensis]MBL7563139.1 GspH/FimT family pseudopilin [Legionella bononiensis]
MLVGSHTMAIKNANNVVLFRVCVIPLSIQNELQPFKKKFRTPFKQTRSRSCLAAFTLIELLVTLLVLSILLMVAIPAFRTMVLNNRLASNTDSLVNALNYARSTALNQAMTIKVCPLGSPGSTTCGADWSAGWIIVTQPTSGTAALLKSQQSSNTDPTLSANTTEVVFDRYGLSTTQSNFTLCDNRGGTFARSVEVLATGYVQTGTTPGQAVWNNGSLTCP